MVTATVASDGSVDGWEQAIFHTINGLPAWLEPPMQAIQLLGVLLVGPAVALVALAFARPRLSLAALAATILKLGSERVVKLAVERQRPIVSTPDAIARGGVPLRGLAFVSGHAVLTAALAGIVSPYLRGRWKVVPLGDDDPGRRREGLPGCAQPARHRGWGRAGPGHRGCLEPDPRGPHRHGVEPQL